MADTTVDATVHAQLEMLGGCWGPYYDGQSTGIVVYVDSNSDISYVSTANGGSTWGTPTNIEAGTVRNAAAWFDQETPGISTDIIHVVWIDDDDEEFKWVDIDLSAGTNGTVQTIASGIAEIDGNNHIHNCAVTIARDGRIYAAYSTSTDNANWVSAMYYSDNGGTTWNSATTPYEDGTSFDKALFFPGNLTDQQDFACIFHDQSASALSIKMYDATADNWTETAINSAAQSNFGFFTIFGGAVRHSDGHLIVAHHTDADTAGDDLLVWDITVDSIASPTVTAKTNVFTNQNESSLAAVFVDQNTDDLYVAYAKGGTWLTSVDVVYHVSTDGASTWGTEQAYSEATADDVRNISTGRSTGATTGDGMFQPAWGSNTDAAVYVNLVNDVAISAPAGGIAHAGFALPSTTGSNVGIGVR